MFDTIWEGLQSFGSFLIDSFVYLIYVWVYGLAAGAMYIVQLLDQMYSIMCGTTSVTYDGSKDFLINVFFHNTTINNIYWAIALIGIILSFVFTMISVWRKSVDAGDKIRQPLGGILTGLFKSILLIVSMSAIMTVVLYSTNVLFTQINYAFQNGENLNKRTSIEYTDEQFAAMARALDTIGNYSLNPSYSSRYNMNSCYNNIRDDLYFLQQTGVFDFQYDTSETGATWQSVLQRIVNAADPTKDLAFDEYNEGVSQAIEAAMKEMQNNSYFYPLESYSQKLQISDNQYLSLDRIIFLISTSSAAKNSSYNENMSLTDPLRSAYYYGQKSIYNLNDVQQDFDITSLNYVLLFFMVLNVGWNLAVIIMNCVARIFNMLFLYLISPLVISTIPLDDGAKTKQWSNAFVVQSVGVLGTIVSMRLLVTLMPIIMGSDLIMFENGFLNTLAKALLIIGCISVSKRASSMLTGILADNGGMASAAAGDMSAQVKRQRDRIWRYTKAITGLDDMFKRKPKNQGGGQNGSSAGAYEPRGGDGDAGSGSDLPQSTAAGFSRDNGSNASSAEPEMITLPPAARGSSSGAGSSGSGGSSGSSAAGESANLPGRAMASGGSGAQAGGGAANSQAQSGSLPSRAQSGAQSGSGAQPGGESGHAQPGGDGAGRVSDETWKKIYGPDRSAHSAGNIQPSDKSGGGQAGGGNEANSQNQILPDIAQPVPQSGNVQPEAQADSAGPQAQNSGSQANAPGRASQPLPNRAVPPPRDKKQ